MTETVTLSPLLEPAEVQRILRCSPRTLWRLKASGELRAVQIGRLVKFDPADVEAYIERQKTPRKNLTS